MLWVTGKPVDYFPRDSNQLCFDKSMYCFIKLICVFSHSHKAILIKAFVKTNIHN